MAVIICRLFDTGMILLKVIKIIRIKLQVKLNRMMLKIFESLPFIFLYDHYHLH